MTKSGGVAATQVRRAAANDGGGGSVGRCERAAASALGLRPGGAMEDQRCGGLTMVMGSPL